MYVLKKSISILIIFCFIFNSVCIAVRTEEFEAGTVFFEDFETYLPNSVPDSDFIESSSEDTVRIIDDGSENNVLEVKNYKNSPALPVSIIINYGRSFKGGTYEFSYKIRFKNHSIRFAKLFNLQNGSGEATKACTSYYRYFYLDNVSPLDIETQMDALDRYCTVTQTVDFDNMTYRYLINGLPFGNVYKLAQNSIDSAKTELFYDPQTIACNGNLYESENSDRQVGTYYIDDIKVRSTKLECISSGVDTKEKVKKDIGVIKAEFNYSLLSENIKRNNIAIYENGYKLNDGYNVKAYKNIIYIYFNNELIPGAHYRIKAENINSSMTEIAAEQEIEICEFTVQEVKERRECVFYEDFEDTDAGVTPDLIGDVKQNMTYPTAVEYDGDNKALKIQNNTEMPEIPVDEIINFGSTFSDGVYDFSYKIKFKNHSVYFSDLFSLANATGNTTRASTSYYRYFYLNNESPLDIEQQIHAINNYCTITQRVNFNAGTYSFYINGVQLGAVYVLNNDSIDRAKIRLYYRTDNLAYNGNLYEVGGSTNVGTYYIYEIKIEKVGFMTSNEGIYLRSAEIYDDNGEKIHKISGGNITAKIRTDYSESNLSEWVVIMALKDQNDKLVSVKIEQCSTGTGGEVQAEFTVPQDEQEYKIEYFIWDSQQSAVPLIKKGELGTSLEIYVDCDALPEGDGTFEKPYSSIIQAKNRIRKIAETGQYPTGGISVILREGKYNVGTGLEFTSADSGKDDSPILWTAYKNEDVTITCGEEIKLSEFSKANNERIDNALDGEIYSAKLSELALSGYEKMFMTGHSQHYYWAYGLADEGEPEYGTPAPEIFFGGNAGTLARYPNEGYMTIDSVVDAGSYEWNNNVNSDSVSGFKISVSDERIKRWGNADDAWMWGWWSYDWSDMSTPVSQINTEEKTITSQYASYFKVTQGQRFYIYNLIEELDMPGEWYYDKDTDILYVYPPENFSDNDTITLAFKNDNIITMNGTENVVFKNLHITGTRGNGIEIGQCRNILIDSCRIDKISHNGITAAGKNIKIENTVISDIGANAIKLSGGGSGVLSPSGSQIKNCIIHDYARIIKGYSAGINMGGVGHMITGCEIYNAPHCGILFGGNDNIISDNNIHDILKETSDMGAIYCVNSMVQRGNLISGNYIHDLYSNSKAAISLFGIYFDNMQSGNTVTDNILSDIEGTGVFLHGGRDNTVTDNYFINLADYGVGLVALGRVDSMKNARRSDFGISYETTSGAYLKYPHITTLMSESWKDPAYNVICNNVSYNVRVPLYLYLGNDVGSDMTLEELYAMCTLDEGDIVFENPLQNMGK